MSVYFPSDVFGLPLRDGYTIDTDSALLRTPQVSGHTRQRRTYLHQASRINFTYRMTLERANQFLAWVAKNRYEWWRMNTLTGNTSGSDVCAAVEVKLSSDITINRVQMTSTCLVSFYADIYALDNWDIKRKVTASAYKVPPPKASTFTETHAARGVTTYNFEWDFTTEQLQDFIDFASYIGTNWFQMPMISANVPCGNEWVRFTSGINQSLTGPNVFSVAVTAETLPSVSL